MELPHSGHATVDENFESIIITIPSRKNWFIVVFLGFWMCGWFLGETSALKEIVSSQPGGVSGFLVFWVCGWTVGGFLAFRMFWWNLMGKEIVSVFSGVLTIDKKGAVFYNAKSYDLKEAVNFRVQEDYTSNGPFGNIGVNSLFKLGSSGTIRFDYGVQTIKFAEGIDEAEGEFILTKLRNKKFIK